MSRRAHGDRRIFVGVQRINLAVCFTDPIYGVGLSGLRAQTDAAQSILRGLHSDQRPVFFRAGFELLP